MEDSDQDLIDKCLAGKREAFASLVLRYQKLVFNVIHRMTGGTEEADDLSQEVFLRAFRSLGTYRREFRVATWLMKIATNVCLDSFRRRRHASLEPKDAEAVHDSRPGPQDRFAEEDETERMRRVIGELPEEYRVPLVLFHLQGLRYGEIEEVLGQPETIVKNRLYRARGMLRERMAPKQEEALP